MTTVSLVSTWNRNQDWDVTHLFRGKHVERLCPGRVRWPCWVVGVHCWLLVRCSGRGRGINGGWDAMRVGKRVNNQKWSGAAIRCRGRETA